MSQPHVDGSVAPRTFVAAGLATGDLIASKYRVERVIGQGGMGIVALATHEALGLRVAVKLLSLAGNAQMKARFQREARAAATLQSRHTTKVWDVGELPDGTPYMVMEYLEGQDLSAIIEKRGPLPLYECVEYLLQACEGLGEAHAAGIIHRDLKPANLFLTFEKDGRPLVKILDFGISKLSGGTADLALTGTMTILGSPLYMSPEQLRATRTADERSDIWSLGIVLFEILSGTVPFNASAITELAIRVVQEPAPSIQRLRADVPAEVAAIIAKCLEKDPNARFQNVLELATALHPFAIASTTEHRVQRMARMSGGPTPSPARPEGLGATSDAWGNQTGGSLHAAARQVSKRSAVPGWAFAFALAACGACILWAGLYWSGKRNARMPLPEDRKHLPALTLMPNASSTPNILPSVAATALPPALPEGRDLQRAAALQPESSVASSVVVAASASAAAEGVRPVPRTATSATGAVSTRKAMPLGTNAPGPHTGKPLALPDDRN
jgi:eukaryotic-like serine/threonine-protein kinase